MNNELKRCGRKLSLPNFRSYSGNSVEETRTIKTFNQNIVSTEIRVDNLQETSLKFYPYSKFGRFIALSSLTTWELISFIHSALASSSVS
jgi:hypothetical protein